MTVEQELDDILARREFLATASRDELVETVVELRGLLDAKGEAYWASAKYSQDLLEKLEASRDRVRCLSEEVVMWKGAAERARERRDYSITRNGELRLQLNEAETSLYKYRVATVILTCTALVGLVGWLV